MDSCQRVLLFSGRKIVAYGIPVVESCWLRYGTLRQFSRKQAMFYCASTDPADWCPKDSPKNKGVSPYIPLQAGYRGNKIKKQGLTHIWLYAIL
jgi:hypothetical protein